MKRRFQFKKLFGTKGIFLAAVSLILVAMTAVGATASWIEEVSQVEFSSTDGQETPLHVGDKVLKSDAVIKQSPTTETISLGDYFYKSGDMHLSPCYSDGVNFVFPVDKNGGSGYRDGTKDDANVNYLSTSFRVRSEGAGTAYWFEKSGESNNTPFITFKNSETASNDTTLAQYLRLSITVDGATNVYALNSTGKFKVVSNNTVTEKTGRRIDQYTYYNEVFNADGSSNTSANNAFANQGAGGNLNGNTLFTVNKYDVQNKSGAKNVTVKLWLEYNGQNTASVNVASININIVSSWAKTRRIYVKDETVDEIDNGSATGAHWLTQQSTPTLHWALRTNTDIHWEKKGNVSTYVQYFDVPAVYNNASVALFRCNNGWNKGGTHPGDINYWDKYETTFPDTFHSETYTVYTKKFATWDSVARYVEIINSCHFTMNGTTQFSEPYAYMWDSSTDTGAADKVVQNASWPGASMTKLNLKKSNLDVYAFYYNSIFDRIVFNDDFNPSSAAYQTADINLDKAKTQPQYYSGKVFDMATMKWYDNFNSLPTYSDYSVYSEVYNSSDNQRFTVSRMVKNPNNSNEVYCRVYVRYQNTGGDFYRLKVMKNDQSEWWGWGHDNTSNAYWWVDGEMTGGNKPTLENGNNSNDIRLHATNTTTDEYKDASGNYHPGVYGIYFNTSTHELWIQKEHIN